MVEGKKSKPVWEAGSVSGRQDEILKVPDLGRAEWTRKTAEGASELEM